MHKNEYSTAFTLNLVGVPDTESGQRVVQALNQIDRTLLWRLDSGKRVSVHVVVEEINPVEEQLEIASLQMHLKRRELIRQGHTVEEVAYASDEQLDEWLDNGMTRS